jgi:acetyltransferase-like isoleucine patch superfamily enzyme
MREAAPALARARALARSGPSSKLAEMTPVGDVRVGQGTIVHEDVELGGGTTIGELCVLGTGEADTPLRIGRDSLVRSHSVLYRGAELGPRLQTGHHVLVRSGANAGTNLHLGSYSSLEGAVEIGDFVRIAGRCELGPGTVIRDFAWLFPGVICMNDPLPPSSVRAGVEIGEGAVVCTGALLFPGARIGEGAFVSAGAHVAGDVEPLTVVLPDGSPGGAVKKLIHLDSGTRHPWPRHFSAGYPDEARERLTALRERLLGR